MSNTAQEKSLSPLDIVLWLIVAALVAFSVVVSGTELFGEFPQLYRVIAAVVALAIAFFVFLQTTSGKLFNQFRKDALQELRRVIWPSRQETVQTSLVVVAVIAFVAILLFAFDQLISWLFRLVGIIG